MSLTLMYITNNPTIAQIAQKYGVESIQQQILFENYMPDEYASRLEMLCIALFV